MCGLSAIALSFAHDNEIICSIKIWTLPFFSQIQTWVTLSSMLMEALETIQLLQILFVRQLCGHTSKEESYGNIVVCLLAGLPS